MLNTRKILYWAVTAVCCGLLPCGCVKEDAASLGERHDVAVRLNVGTCAVGETDGTPTGEESAIHSLRVYAFVKGQLAGHEFRSGDTGYILDGSDDDFPDYRNGRLLHHREREGHEYPRCRENLYGKYYGSGTK